MPIIVTNFSGVDTGASQKGQWVSEEVYLLGLVLGNLAPPCNPNSPNSEVFSERT